MKGLEFPPMRSCGRDDIRAYTLEEAQRAGPLTTAELAAAVDGAPCPANGEW
jgi:hypothetical protein